MDLFNISTNYSTFRIPTGETETIIAYKSKVLSDESINPPTTLGNRFAPKLK